jgi:uncharacterized membrane protein YkoI
MKTAYYLSPVLAAMLCLASTSRAQQTDDANKVALAKQVLGQAKVGFAAALATAQKKVPEGKPLIARVELTEENARFGFYFLEGQEVHEVEVDVTSGEVLKSKEKKEPEKEKKLADAIKAVQDSRVSFQEAMEIGAKRIKAGKLLEVELEFDVDRAIVELEYLVEGRITRVRIDAKDATAVAVK